MQQQDFSPDMVGEQVAAAVSFLCAGNRVPPGALIVLGCSTSEIGGGHIGKSGSPVLGETVVRAAMQAADAADVTLCVQCCEHLNRALVLPRETAKAHGYAPVSAVPHPHAGGSAASAYYRLLPDPVLVEQVVASGGLDIGETLIGMHLAPVAVPLRPETPYIGRARLTMAFSRPKYIGGPRAQYTL